MQTVYQKTHGALIPQGGRAVATFPSGLCRVDQTFICPTSAELTHRTALAVGNDFPVDDSPAVDGLKIFPAVQEVRRGDGFTEFRVSGYGRTGDESSNVKLSRKTFTRQFIYNDSTWYQIGTGPGESTEGSITIVGTPRELNISFYLNEISGEIVGDLINPDGSVRVPVPSDVLGVQGFSASSGWTVESISNSFTEASLLGSCLVILKWQIANVDGTFYRAELDIRADRVRWVVDSDNNFGAISEYKVTGTREIIRYIISDQD